MTWQLTGDEDTDNGLRHAMAAVIFERLQSAEILDKSTTMDSKVPGGDLAGETYGDALNSLIADHDVNGRLDLDVYALQFSGIIPQGVKEDSVEKAIANQFHSGLETKFFARQRSNSEFGLHHAQELGELSKGMNLTDTTRAKNDLFLEKVTDRLANGEGDRVGGEALGKAQIQTRHGREREAERLLLGTADRLLESGDSKNAKALYAELAREPHQNAALNAAQEYVDDYSAKGEKIPAGYGPSLATDHAKLTLDPGSHATTYGAVADHRLKQIDFQEKMNASLGRGTDPLAQADAREYFAHFAKDHSTAEVRDELGAYLNAFYKHTGSGVSWEGIAEDDRSSKLDELFSGLPRDGAGRKLVDCEGFAYLTGGLLDRRRFDVNFVQRPGHIITAVVDRQSRDVFTVNNQTVKEVPGKAQKNADVTPEQLGFIAREAGTQRGSWFGYAQTPSSAFMSTPDGVPKIGAHILGMNGEPAGVVDVERQAYAREKLAARHR